MITLVCAYYENPEMLTLQLEEWKNVPPGTLRVVLVDDCSQIYPAERFVRAFGHGVDLELYRVSRDRPWGQDGARNIGMHVARTAWCLLTDMDHMLSASWAFRADTFAQFSAKRGTYYLPRRVRTSGAIYHPHPNSFLFNRTDFWDMGGYDEDFVGWYGSDGNFRKCAKGYGLHEVLTEEFSLVLYGSNDCPDARTTAFTRKEGPYWAAKNPELNRKRMGPPYIASNPLRTPYTRVL